MAQVQKAQAKSPVLLVVGQASQPVRDRLILVTELGLVAVTSLVDTQGITPAV